MNRCTTTIFLITALVFVNAKVPSIEDIALEENAVVMNRSLLDGDVNPSAPPTASSLCDPEQISCDNDELTICGLGYVEQKIPCSMLFHGRGGFCSCDKTQCVAERPLCINEDTTTCLREGEKMPTHESCGEFTYCDENKEKISFRCPTGMNYNPRRQKCLAEPYSCPRLMCTQRKILEWIPHPHAPEYYLFCLNGIGEMRKCTQEGYGMYNGTCQFQCMQEGSFTDPKKENCEKGMWHSCTKRGNSFFKQTQYCSPVNQKPRYYDESIGMCVKANTCIQVF